MITISIACPESAFTYEIEEYLPCRALRGKRHKLRDRDFADMKL